MAPESVKWLQLYVLSSQEMTKKIVKRAEKEGYKAIVLTVDGTAVSYTHLTLPTNREV